MPDARCRAKTRSGERSGEPARLTLSGPRAALAWVRTSSCTRIAVEQFQRGATASCVGGFAAASMRYHDEIRVFSRLLANSVVGNNQRRGRSQEFRDLLNRILG